MKRLVWPPKVGSRICRDTGWDLTSWSGSVRAVFDEDFAVVRLRRIGHIVISRFAVESSTCFFQGGLPRVARKEWP